MSGDRVKIKFAWIEAKEKACTEPVYNILKEHPSVDVSMVDLRRRNQKPALHDFNADYAVVGYINTIDYLRSDVAKEFSGKIIQVDHGLGILKDHGTHTHHIAVDLNILQGAFWKERLEKLYPDHVKKFVIGGFPKSDALINSTVDRKDLCKTLGLDSDKPIILFAPTWRRDGHFNIIDLLFRKDLKYFDDIPNILVVPHPSNYNYVKKYIKSAPMEKVAASVKMPNQLVKEEANINTYLKLADVLVTDISSTGVEFGILKKPVVHLVPEIYLKPESLGRPLPPLYPDCSAEITKDGFFIEPTTKELVNYSIPATPKNLVSVLKKLCDDGPTPQYLEAQQHWIQRIAYKSDGNASKRVADIILDYIGSEESL